MCSSFPLFDQAVLISGTATSLPILGPEHKELEYTALLKYLDIEINDPLRLQKLRQVPVDDLIAALEGLGVVFINPWADERFFPRGIPNHFNEEMIVGSCDWVKGIVVGDSFYEVSLNLSDSVQIELTVSRVGFCLLCLRISSSRVSSLYQIIALVSRIHPEFFQLTIYDPTWTVMCSGQSSISLWAILCSRNLCIKWSGTLQVQREQTNRKCIDSRRRSGVLSREGTCTTYQARIP